MNHSKNKSFKPYTKDKHLVEEGDVLYFADTLYFRILKFKVSGWHDGKSSNLGFSCGYYVNMRGGAGVYAKNCHSVFQFFDLKFCFNDFEKCKNFIKRSSTASFKRKLKKLEQCKQSHLNFSLHPHDYNNQ